MAGTAPTGGATRLRGEPGNRRSSEWWGCYRAGVGRAWLGVLVIGSCGRIGFNEALDAAAGTVETPTPPTTGGAYVMTTVAIPPR